jgi:hypothetical protein
VTSNRGVTRYRFSYYDDPTRTFARAVAEVIGTLTTQLNLHATYAGDDWYTAAEASTRLTLH